MTSQFVIGTKWLFGVPITKTFWRGKVGTRDFVTCNVIVPIMSLSVTSINYICKMSQRLKKTLLKFRCEGRSAPRARGWRFSPARWRSLFSSAAIEYNCILYAARISKGSQSPTPFLNYPFFVRRDVVCMPYRQ